MDFDWCAESIIITKMDFDWCVSLILRKTPSLILEIRLDRKRNFNSIHGVANFLLSKEYLPIFVGWIE
ncbi:hypothetical protein DLK05_07530 [Ancylomarina longa]|uniref:Uncharacterized protein n=1 Tax=Ancylomarina longa TaxID=2487017 RepID=A0A434AWB7_9BACT|nr:hypothetical protein DLK05_07530 [Ancylomarina longa]